MSTNHRNNDCSENIWPMREEKEMYRTLNIRRKKWIAEGSESSRNVTWNWGGLVVSSGSLTLETLSGSCSWGFSNSIKWRQRCGGSGGGHNFPAQSARTNEALEGNIGRTEGNFTLWSSWLVCDSSREGSGKYVALVIDSHKKPVLF